MTGEVNFLREYPPKYFNTYEDNVFLFLSNDVSRNSFAEDFIYSSYSD